MGKYQLEQRKLFDELEQKFKRGESSSTTVEPVKDYIHDNRICLTSVVFIPPKLQEKILLNVIKPLKETGDKQYYYIPGSFHLTIQNIRTVNHPPLFSDKDVELARMVFRQVVPRFKSFNFEMRGLFELPTSLSLRAYSGETIKHLALTLRERLEQSGVSDNKTYASDEIIFGNVSVSRYTTKPNRLFFQEIQRLKNISIGTLKASTISLITTNSVCYPNKTKIIDNFSLQ